MGWADRFIASCNSWGDFWEFASKLSKDEKGDAFERLTQLYLQTAPEYQTKLQNVWLLCDVPPNIRRQLNLPGPDEGIDLIACTVDGEYWAIQAKFRSERDKPLNRTKVPEAYGRRGCPASSARVGQSDLDHVAIGA